MWVGFELNQQGHAALHRQASSSWPTIFHGVFSDAAGALSAAPRAARTAPSAATGTTHHHLLPRISVLLRKKVAGQSPTFRHRHQVAMAGRLESRVPAIP